MSIRKIINLVENAMPSVEDIEGEIAPPAPMTTTSKEFNPPQLIDRSGRIRPSGQDTLDRVAADGWVALIYVDKGLRVIVKLDGHKVTREALAKAIEILEASSAGDIRIEDLTTRVPQNFTGWTRAGGLAILKTLLRKIKAIRAFGGDPKPGRLAYGGVPGAFDVAEASLRESYLLELMEATEDEVETMSSVNESDDGFPEPDNATYRKLTKMEDKILKRLAVKGHSVERIVQDLGCSREEVEFMQRARGHGLDESLLETESSVNASDCKKNGGVHGK